MNITTDGMRDEVSITGLKDEEYTILIGALREAAKDIENRRPDYTLVYARIEARLCSFSTSFGRRMAS